MNRIATVMKIHARDKFTWVIVPWCFVLLASFLVNLLIGALVETEEGIYSGGLSSIFVYLFVLGIITLVQTFPFSLGLSIRRTDYYAGTSIMFVLSGVVIATVLLLLSIVENDILKGWGVNVHFFYLPYLSDGSLAEQWWTLFGTAMHLAFSGFFISSIYRRFGRMGMFILFPVLILLTSVLGFLCTYYGWWMDIFVWFGRHTAAELATWLFVAAVFYALLSFMMIRKATFS